MSTIWAVPYRSIGDASKLRRLLDAVLMIESDVELPVLLRHFVEEACVLVDARYGALGVLSENRTTLEQFVTVGLSEEQEAAIGPRPTGRGVLGLLITEPTGLRLDDLTRHADSYGFPPNHPPMSSFLGVPVRARGEVYGNLYLTNKINAPSFTEEDESLAEGLALAAGIAIENARLNERLQHFRVAEDRERIARDLHDRVIQSIFAVGLALENATRLTDRDDVVQIVNSSVDHLDSAIDELRSAIFQLGPIPAHGSFRQGIAALLDQLAPLLGVRPSLQLSGPVDDGTSQANADHVLAVLRESLVNIAKHAHATDVTISLSIGDELVLSVQDNGIGIQESDVTSGLGVRNMRNRARRLGGTCSFESVPGSGTKLTFCIPL